MNKYLRLFIYAAIFVFLAGSAVAIYHLTSSGAVEEWQQSVLSEQDTQDQPEELITQAQHASSAGHVLTVAKVIDGDTIMANDGMTIRLIGIDTPETVDPRRPVGCFGKEASNFTKQLLLGKQISVEKDVSETDKYGRLLRYVYLYK